MKICSLNFLLAIALLAAVQSACSAPRRDPEVDALETVDVPNVDSLTPDVPSAIDAISPVDSQVRCFEDAGAGARVCSGVCVDTLTDSQNCGGCGMACLAGAVCTSGVCEVRCAAGLVKCDGRCIDPRTNNAFCGASGACDGVNAGDNCARGLFCIRGRCETVCPPLQINCNGTCVDPNTNVMFCGASGDCTGMNAGTACMGGEVCALGRCAANCPPGFVNCNGNCVDPQSSVRFCGADAMCTAGSYTPCAAGQVCSGGRCGSACGTGTLRCGNPPACADPLTSRRFCGASGDCTGAGAGRECGVSEQCLSGRCVYFEPPASEVTPFPDAAEFELLVVPRPITLSISSVLPGTIYFTTDGTEPRPGTGSTMSAPNIAAITVGNPNVPVQLRWFMDYGGVYGRESNTQQRLILVSPNSAVSHGFFYENLRFNGGVSTALVAAGSPVTVSMQHTLWHSGPGGYCPGCVVIQFQSTDTTQASSAQLGPNGCAMDNGAPYPGQQRVMRQFTFNAPMQRGRYAIRGGLSLDYGDQCPRYAGGEPIGYFYVR